MLNPSNLDQRLKDKSPAVPTEALCQHPERSGFAGGKGGPRRVSMGETAACRPQNSDIKVQGREIRPSVDQY